MPKKLMHKNTEVCSLFFKKTGTLEAIKNVKVPELLFGGHNEEEATAKMRRWFIMRHLPYRRNDIHELLNFYNKEMFLPEDATERSLSDNYWIKTTDEQCWENINAFDNWESDEDDIIRAVFRPEEFVGANGDSPNFTLPGAQERFWITHPDGRLGLANKAAHFESIIKRTAIEQGVSDILASREFLVFAQNILIFTPTQTSQNIESISLDSLYFSLDTLSDSKMENLAACCETYGLNNWMDFFRKMSILDSQCDRDRDLNDIAILRDANTLKYLSFALL